MNVEDPVMHGQWLGSFKGEAEGTIVIDLDDGGGHYEGHALAFGAGNATHGLLVEIKTIDKSAKQNLVCRNIAVMHPSQSRAFTMEEVTQLEIEIPESIQIDLSFSDRLLNLLWTAADGTSGEAVLYRSDPTRPSDLKPIQNVTTWKQFLDFALSLEPNRFVFRGQPTANRLRTSFHRTRRSDLVAYLRDDIMRAHHALTGQTKHFFSIGDPFQNASFLNLLQHHGFPPPLLDWTYSPFVAAFFAYRKGFQRENGSNVRIFILDKDRWVNELTQVHTIAFAAPHFSMIETLNFENPRALPQQSISSITNLDDIESYLEHVSRDRGHDYLQVVDLPFNDRRAVMEQLKLMGITAASLFPGLDGACEELRGRFFHPVS
jgi:hypothetical protein